MSNYVKYTAADGTVHLCHEDSPMLMHANFFKTIGRKAKSTAREVKEGVSKGIKKVIDDTIGNILVTVLNDKVSNIGYTFSYYNSGIIVQDKKGNKKRIPLDTFTSVIGMDDLINIAKNTTSGNTNDVENAVKNIVIKNGDKMVKTMNSILFRDNTIYDFRERVEKKRR